MSETHGKETEMERMVSDVGKWFDRNDRAYNPFKANSVDSYVCHEVGDYVGSYENSVMDGYYDRFPLHRWEAVSYAYDLYMDNLPKGVRYQGKEHFERLAEKVVKGLEDAWGDVNWLPDNEVAVCLIED